MRLAILFLLIFPSYVLAGDFIVIANRHGPLVETGMAGVRDIYLGGKRFANDTRLLPVNFTEGAMKDHFLEAVVDMSSKEYKLHWVKLVFQEGLSLPRSMGSATDILEFVAKEKGAVAYVPASWSELVRAGPSGGLEGVVIIGP